MARNIADRERDYKALELHRRGLTHRQIAAELGWSSHVSAANGIQRALAELTQVNKPEARKLMRDRLDEYRRQAWRVLGTRHYLTAPSGKLVRHPDTGTPLVDDGPILQALDRLLRYDMEERKLLGLDAPVQHRVNVITEDDTDAAIRDLVEKHARLAAEGVTVAADADSGAA